MHISTYQDPVVGSLCQYQWQVDNAIGTVMFCHGVQEHMGRYDRLAAALNQLQINLVALDHPGHGRSYSEGLIADVQSPRLMPLAQIQRRFLATIDGPVVVMGHSMGAFIANYLAQEPLSVKGLALLSSAGNLNPVATVGYPLVWLTSKFWQKGGLPEQLCFLGFNRSTSKRTKKDWLCSDPAAVDQNLADPYCDVPLPSRTAVALAHAGKHCFTRRSLAKLPDQFPILMTAGKADPLSFYGRTVTAAARQLAKMRHQPVTCWLFPDARHEIIHEQMGEEYAQRLSVWAKDCLTGAQQLDHIKADSTE